MNDITTFSLSKELEKADFGDKRLTTRLIKLVNQVGSQPSKGLPELTGSVSALEAAYRFFANPKVTPEKILLPHVEATCARARSAARVVVAHDKTDLIFGGKSRQGELGSTKQNNQGFVGLFSLALSRREFVQPLGLLGCEAIFNCNQSKKKKKSDSQRRVDPRRDALNWWGAIHTVEYLFPEEQRPIHVMDREADEYELFSDLVAHHVRFVIRIHHNRANCVSGEKQGKLYDLLEGFEVVCKREVPISKREKSRFPGNDKRNPPRAARIANLHITAAAIEVTRSSSAHIDCPRTVKLNCVHVYEVDAPTGIEPVNWKLFTTEPIGTSTDVLNVIDDYRARWTIEEYFKALKSGCAYERRQLESRASLLNALAVFAPMAWQLLLLRTLNRQHPDVSAEYALTKTQIDVLTAVSKNEISDSPTINEAFLAIAALGGHIPNNGSPGWLILSRGMEKLLTMEVAWMAAIKRCDQS